MFQTPRPITHYWHTLDHFIDNQCNQSEDTVLFWLLKYISVLLSKSLTINVNQNVRTFTVRRMAYVMYCTVGRLSGLLRDQLIRPDPYLLDRLIERSERMERPEDSELRRQLYEYFGQRLERGSDGQQFRVQNRNIILLPFRWKWEEWWKWYRLRWYYWMN